jgi:hypothetical protein
VAVPKGHLTPQRRDTLDAVWAAHQDTWVSVKQVMLLGLEVGVLSVKSRLEGLSGAGYMDRRKVLGSNGYQLEFRVNEKGRQYVRPVE